MSSSSISSNTRSGRTSRNAVEDPNFVYDTPDEEEEISDGDDAVNEEYGQNAVFPVAMDHDDDDSEEENTKTKSKKRRKSSTSSSSSASSTAEADSKDEDWTGVIPAFQEEPWDGSNSFKSRLHPSVRLGTHVLALVSY